MYMINHETAQLLLRQCIPSIAKRHSMQAIASCQLRQLGHTHSILHSLMTSAVQDILRVPAPDPFPSLIWVNLQRIQDHGQTGWPTVGRILLSRELFC